MSDDLANLAATFGETPERFLRNVQRSLQQCGVAIGLSPIVAGIQARRMMVALCGRAAPAKRRMPKIRKTTENAEHPKFATRRA